MAAKLTHLEVYRQSLTILEHGNSFQEDLAESLKAQPWFKYGCTGSIAPDIFYFYRISSRKKNRLAMSWGNRIHHKKTYDIVLTFLDRAKKEADKHRKLKKLAFALGYISHCATDVVTHPYIFYITGDYYSEDPAKAQAAQEDHLRVEYTLDSYLIQERLGISPRKYNFLKYVDVREKTGGRNHLDFDIWQMWIHALATVYPDEFRNDYPGKLHRIEKDDLVNEAYLSFIKLNRIVDTRSRIVRGALRAVDFLTFRKLKTKNILMPLRTNIDPRLMNQYHRQWRFPADPQRVSTESFDELVNRAANYSAEAMTDAAMYVLGNKSRKDLKKYAGYNLDTGIQSDSVQMIAFDPLTGY